MDSDSDNDSSNPWSFTAARRLLRSFRSESEQSSSLDTRDIPDPASFDPTSSISKSLGDFDRLLSFCGKPLNVPVPKVSSDPSVTPQSRASSATTYQTRGNSTDTSSSSFLSDRSTLPTSAPEDDTHDSVEHFDDYICKIKGVRWKDETAGLELAETRRRSTHSIITDHLDAAGNQQVFNSDSEDVKTPLRRRRRRRKPSSSRSIIASDFESDGATDTEPEISTPLPQPIYRTPTLLPASVNLPANYLQSLVGPPPPIPTLFDPSRIEPIYTLTFHEQKAKLVKKLRNHFGTELALKADPVQIIAKLGRGTSSNGIHVFVDLSNIAIGFYHRLKFNRGIRKEAYVKQPPFSFSSLALVLERGRPVARRVLVGSHVSMLYNKLVTLPRHIIEAGENGYELNILERVCKPQSSSKPRKKRGGTGSGYATSGHSSASESTSTVRVVMVEQAVDELLQMKLLESLIDNNRPSTVVLASGDAAEAEFSGGFLKNVERAMLKGWKVELVAWKHGLNGDYRSRDFLKRWENKFTIIELDEFCEEMLGVYLTPFPKDLEQV